MIFKRLPVLLAGVMLVSGAAFAQSVSTDAEITVTNSASPQGVRTLHFGVDPNATNGIDKETTCEDLFPPFPPTATFEARFVSNGGSELGEGSPCDFRPFTSQSQTDEYKIQIQPGTNGMPVKISWDMNYMVTNYKSVKLTDAFGGVIANVDMRTTGSYDLTNEGLKELLIFAEGPGGPPAGVDDAVAGTAFHLESLPNPVAGKTAIRYELLNAATVTLTLTDANGREVARLVDGDRQQAGEHTVQFDAVDLAAGSYFYTLTADGASTTRRLIKVR